MSAIESFARIPRVLALLTRHPDGLPISTVAADIGIDEQQLRDDILQYYSAEIPPDALMGLSRTETIEFLGTDGSEEDPASATILRVTTDRPTAELGLEYLRGDQLATLFVAARGLAQTEPENRALSEAVSILGESFLQADPAQSGTEEKAPALAVLRRALDSRRAVAITYSRQWQPGVSTRVVHPYALHHTHRGWELDAGPLKDGRPRTFLIDRVIQAEISDETFDRPAAVDEILAAERVEVQVEFSLPQRTHWVVDRFAESSVVVSADQNDLGVVARFLPPVAHRVGLILAISGPDAFVIEPQDLAGAGAALATQLLAHHGFTADDSPGAVS